MKRVMAALLLAVCLFGCRTARQPEALTELSTKLLTYNVNWRGAGADQKDRSSPTWHWKYRGITLKRRMDHIMYSPELHFGGAAVLKTGPSDHFPVLAWFSKGDMRSGDE